MIFSANCIGDLMRMLIGGGFAGIGGLNLYCSFMIDNSAVEGNLHSHRECDCTDC